MPRNQPSQAVPSTTLTAIENMILLGFSVKINLQKALKLYETSFRDVIKNHLLRLPAAQREITVAGMVKVSIVDKGGQAAIDATAVENSFTFSLREDVIHATELQALFESGAIGIKDYSAVANLLGQRGQRGPHDGTFITPADDTLVTHDLRWQVLQPTREGAGVFGDLEDRVRLAANATLSPDDLAALLPQAAATVPAVPQASDTVAVRASNPRRSRPRQP